LSRAHRIGQKKKVLCIQLVTRASAEEKIMQYGRKKMALDHVLIEQMDAEDAPDRDLEGILRYGAAELFEDNGEKDVKYDDAAIDKLLDASQVEHTQAGADQTAESTFSFARVWANNDLGNVLPEAPEAEETAPDPSVWDKILKERERVAAAEAADAQQALGRGRRAKAVSIVSFYFFQRSFTNMSQMVDYAPDREMGEPTEGADNDAAVSVLEGSPAPRQRKARNEESDTDFQADSDVESVAEDPNDGNVSADELKTKTFLSKSKLLGKMKSPSESTPTTKKTKTAKVATTPTKSKGKAEKKPRATPKKQASTPKVSKKKAAASSPTKEHAPPKLEMGDVVKKRNEMAMMQGGKKAEMRLAAVSAAAVSQRQAVVIDLTTDSEDDADTAPAPPVQAPQPSLQAPPFTHAAQLAGQPLQHAYNTSAFPHWRQA